MKGFQPLVSSVEVPYGYANPQAYFPFDKLDLEWTRGCYYAVWKPERILTLSTGHFLGT